MATSSIVRDYSQLNTVPAIAGILFAVAAAVQFLGASISIAHPVSYTFAGTEAVVVGLSMLTIAFASSDTKSLEHYETYEQAMIAIAGVTMIGMEYFTEVSDFVNSDPAVWGTAAFAVSMLGWAVVAR